MDKKERTITLNESQLSEVIKMAFDKFGAKPTRNINESELFDEYKFVGEAEEDEPNEENNEPESHVDKITDEQLRIDALKIAVKLSRLMNKVTPEDMLEISAKVASYLKNHKVGEDYVPDEDTAPLEDDSVNPEDAETNDDATDVENDVDNDSTDVEDTEMDETPEEFTLDDEDEEDEEAADEGSIDVPEEFVI